QLAVFTVFLNEVSTSPVVVDYFTTDGTATTGDNDYIPVPASKPGRVTIPAGASSVQFGVAVVGDSFKEGNENFFVHLVDSRGATISRDTGSGLIVDDDGDFGATSFLVKLTPQSRTGTYSYTVGPLIRDRFRTEGMGISVGDATVREGNLGQQNDVFTVFLNGSMPAISIGNATVVEGAGSVATAARFDVFLSAPSTHDVTVNYQTSDGTATVNSDYALTSGKLTIPRGQTQASVLVPIVRDAMAENAVETFSLNLGGPVGATLAGG